MNTIAPTPRVETFIPVNRGRADCKALSNGFYENGHLVTLLKHKESGYYFKSMLNPNNRHTERKMISTQEAERIYNASPSQLIEFPND